jgi:hypothetical protein
MKSVYSFILGVHNIIRWVALILGILITVASFYGWLGKRSWSQSSRRLAVFYTSAMDIQLLLGLLLYIFFSPMTQTAFQDLSAAMGNPVMRFFALEHAFYMLLAVVFAHLGSILAKRAQDDTGKYRRSAIWFGLSIIMLLLGMPWNRPLFPVF